MTLVATPLRDPVDALAARVVALEAARETIDLQYYSWDADSVGYLLLSRIVAAADRGVDVRIIVDDLKMRRSTRAVGGLCQHPHIDVRLFNPWSSRFGAVAQGIEFVRRFGALNQRMHNKLMVVDGRIVIAGGRNVGDEYFGLGHRFSFVDFDVMFEMDDAMDWTYLFDRYWFSSLAVSGDELGRPATDSDLAWVRRLTARELLKGVDDVLDTLVRERTWRSDPPRSSILDASQVSVVADVPGGQGQGDTERVVDALAGTASLAGSEILIATPFFVPTERDVEWYREAVGSGVKVVLVTNSLASNPGTISNSGLKSRRADLVHAGVELHELRIDAADRNRWLAPSGSDSFLGLHAKLYVVDGHTLFLGSVNLDPRSVLINTEIGVVIRDAPLASLVRDEIARLASPDNSWRIRSSDSMSSVEWTSSLGVRRRQPARGLAQRTIDLVLGLLPIEDQI